MKTPRLTSNRVIDLMIGTPRFITKTMTKRGPVFSFDDTMQIVPREIVERMIGKGILVSDDELPGTPPPGGQTYRLDPKWSDRPSGSVRRGEA